MTDRDEFAAALGADVVIEVGPKGRALSLTESLGLRSWFDRRQQELRTRRRGSTYVPGMTPNRTPAFESLPTATDIAHWYVEVKRLEQNVGGDAWWLSRDPHSSCYRVATIDRDVQEHVLLEITTEGTRDLLYVTYGLDGLWCEWWQHPVNATDSDHYWYRDGIEWMADQMIVHEERADSG